MSEKMKFIIIGSNNMVEKVRELLKKRGVADEDIITNIEPNKELVMYPFNKTTPSFPVELLKISQPKLRIKQDKKRKKAFDNIPIIPQKIFFERRRK